VTEKRKWASSYAGVAFDRIPANRGDEGLPAVPQWLARGAIAHAGPWQGALLVAGSSTAPNEVAGTLPWERS
jgi:hypothetical protein